MFKEEEKDRAKKWMDLGTIDHWFRLDMSGCLWGTQVGISVRSTERALRREAKLWGCVGN